MAYPTAIGCGCLLGAGGMSHLFAAEWSMTPVFSWSADYDSNRSLQPGVTASEQAVLSADVRLQRSLENLQLMLEPHFDIRRFSDKVWGPGDDRSLTSGLTWTRERTQFSLNGSIANTNTLTAEALETGLVNTNSRRRLQTVNGALDFSETERRQLYVQAAYMGSSYSGPPDIQELLPGYRYESAALGERFFLTEHLSLSAGAFGDILHSDRPGGSSHEAGAQLGLSYARSEYTTLALQVGQSRRTLAGESSNGTNISASLTRNLELGNVSLNYTRSLVPYGNGFLVERQLITASAKRSLTPYLDVDLTALRVKNNESTVLLRLDRRYEDTLGAGLTWKLGETWTLRSEASASRGPPIGYADDHIQHEWRAALTMTWKPYPQVISR